MSDLKHERTTMIEDEELREIYKVSGAEHVQNLETGILALEKNPQDTELLQTLLREAHSLKGDSRVIGVRSVETLSHRLEEILGRLKGQQLDWSSALGDRLYQAVGAMGKLVHESVTDEPSGVNPGQLLSQLSEFLPANLQTPTPEVPVKANGNGRSYRQRPTLLIEDSELRDIYKISSEEHLGKLQSGLMLLDQRPDDLASLEALLSESQSFELDSHIVGQETLENLIIKLEAIFEAIKTHQLQFPNVSRLLHQELDAIAALAKEAVTGELAPFDPQETLQKLERLLEMEGPADERTDKFGGHTSRATDTALDTIRVPMRYLDALMTHTGELTVTKTRMAHATETIQDLMFSWDDWKNRKHTANALRVKNQEEKLDGLIRYLYTNIAENNTRLDLISRELDEKIRTLRLLPLSTIFLMFPRLVRDLAQEQEKQVEFVMEGGEIAVDKQILEEMKDPLLHLLRNAVDHGIEPPSERQQLGKNPTGKVWLKATRQGGHILIEVGDDGRGIDLEKVKQTAIKRKMYRSEELASMSANQLRSLLFMPGFSTRSFITEISGRGVGLDVVRTNVERLKGNIQSDSAFRQGSVFRMQLRSTVATLNVMLFDVQGLIHALPLEAIEKTLLIRPQDVYSLEGRATITVDDQPIALVKMAELLQLPDLEEKQQQKRQRQVEKVTSAILLNLDGDRLAFEVERLREVLDVVIKPQSQLLKRVRNVVGATILGTGDVCMILNPNDLIKTVQKSNQSIGAMAPVDLEGDQPALQKPVILLVEDSIAVRTQEKRVLEKAGYEVVIAVDGLEGYTQVRSGRHFDAVISDVQMPNMDGLQFTAKVRQHPEYRELPIMLITSLASEEDKRRGAQAGANAYIVKDQFNQELLIETLDRLV
ncbi:MAG: hybrid sensor histidine kinase/response regulator [Snowella sp.]|nr:hybrid sensor histidine kinase/response regulator [Snowella sp.]